MGPLNLFEMDILSNIRNDKFFASLFAVSQEQTAKRNGFAEEHSRTSRTDASCNGTQSCFQNWQITIP